MDQISQKLPNATGALVLGILSIVLCWLFVGIPGIIMGIVGITISKKPMALLKENPEGYTNAGNLKAGKIMSIIGLVLSILVFLLVVIVFSLIGSGIASLGSFI